MSNINNGYGSVPSTSTAANSATHYIDSLLSGIKWGGGSGAGTSLTFSFPWSASSSAYWATNPNYSSLNEPSGAFALSPSEQAAARAALAAWSNVANISFSEIAESSSDVGTIRIAWTTKIQSNFPAWAYRPNNYWTSGGDVWLSQSALGGKPSSYWNPGQSGFSTLLHEFGHSLGVKHPHDGPIVAALSIDAKLFSVMSYRAFVGGALTGSAANLSPTTPMLHDIAAIQYLYGANMSTRSGDTTYNWTVGQNIYETLWDGGGNDTIDWSNQSSAARINLNAGQWSYLGPTRWDGQAYTQQNLAIAYNVVIENATGGTGNDTLVGNSAANTLNGGAGNDQLYGGAGDDVFDWNGSSRGGADTMYGGQGDDTYVIDSLSDVVVELAGEGTDVIWAAITYSIANVANVENLYLFGTQSVNATGNALANYLRGNGAANTLDGGAGNDTLDGGAGADTLIGGIGDDTYMVDNAADTVTVTENANEGTDTVRASVSWTLVANLENLTLTGTAAINGTGNAHANVVTGNSAANRLDGGADNDTMIGSSGNDTLDGGAGTDVAAFSVARASYVITRTDASITVQANSGTDGTDTLTNIERLKFSDGTLALDVGAGEVAGQAYRVYKAAFNRIPDNDGLKYWIGVMDAGATAKQVANGFIASAEFSSLYGTTPSHAVLVTKFYQNVLGRQPEADGYNYWLGLLDAGLALPNDVLAAFSESTENQVKVVGLIQDGIWLV